MISMEEELNLIDNEIVKLLKQRISIINNSQECYNKFYFGDKITTNNDLSNDSIINLFNEINFLNINTKNKKIFYLGPEGSYTQDAAIKKFGINNQFYSINSITNIFEELNKNNANFAVIPIENSLNGLVNDTINAFFKYDLYAIDEVILDIHHTFASNCTDISEIKKIYSKDIAFDQCSSFIEKYNLHNIEQIYVESTTKAAILASKNKESAAICSKIAAIKNKVNIMFNDIEDDSSNKTRFFVLSKNNNPQKENINYKTSFLIKLPNYSGSLIDFLQKFKERNINLYKIKSHITKGVSNFFIEFDGHFKDKNSEDIFKDYINDVKIIGSYLKEIDDI
jgi:chorismate mutase / prephenate dehydratase